MACANPKKVGGIVLSLCAIALAAGQLRAQTTQWAQAAAPPPRLRRRRSPPIPSTKCRKVFVDARDGLLIDDTTVGRGVPLTTVTEGRELRTDDFLPHPLPLARHNKLSYR